MVLVVATSQRRKVKGRSLRSDSFSRLQCHSLLDVRVMQLVCRGRGGRDTGRRGGGHKESCGRQRDRQRGKRERQTDMQADRQTCREKERERQTETERDAFLYASQCD